MKMCCEVETPLGTMTAAAVEDALVGLWFNGQRYFPAGVEGWRSEPQHPVFRELRLELDRYFSGMAPTRQLRLAPQGTPFQREVWELLLRIPHGETVSYGELAAKIAARRGVASMSAQAVGGAVGHNPISILIPCHRVVGSAGGLTGYAGGVERKAALLLLEKEAAISAHGSPGPSEPRRR